MATYSPLFLLFVVIGCLYIYYKFSKTENLQDIDEDDNWINLIQGLNISDAKPLTLVNKSECPCISSRMHNHNKNIIICILKKNMPSNIMQIISNKSNFKIVESSFNRTLPNFVNCTVIGQFTSRGSKYFSVVVREQCPGQCAPIPTMTLPNDILKLPKDFLLTCSMTLRSALKSSTLLNSHEVVEIIKIMAQRRLEECLEVEYWPQSKNYGIIPKRNIDGFILWIGGTIDRIQLGQNQTKIIKVLNAQENRLFRNKMVVESESVGWLATDAEYPCRINSTFCTTAFKRGRMMVHRKHMPETDLHHSKPYWACAQRRPLRALSHLLSLFDPKYILIVDDDTYVNPNMLVPGSPLHRFIHNNLSKDNTVLGEMYQATITNKGYFYGGAGYLMGKAVTDRLISHTLHGPKSLTDANRRIDQTLELSVLHEAHALSNHAHCTSCVRITDTPTCAHVPFVNCSATSAVRAVDLCMNLMSEEATCYHSDHALTRCFAHGIYADLMHVYCDRVNASETISKHAYNVTHNNEVLDIGMCYRRTVCNTTRHLTCHRWKPRGDDVHIPVLIDPLHSANYIPQEHML